MKKRDFLKTSLTAASTAFIPKSVMALIKKGDKLRTAHIGVGGMGAADLASIASHPDSVVVGLCDVDANAIAKASASYPKAKAFKDYRVMLKEMINEIDAVVVSTPDHTHAPASILAMEMNKPVYCQKPLAHHVSEVRAMRKIAKEKNLVTQMGIQVHSFYDYKLATLLIQSGIVGKISRVRAWSPKNWGYDGPEPKGIDPIPFNLDWNLWLGTAEERSYKNKVFHPGNWRKLVDFGCGTLGDMGVHIFDTPYNALNLDVPNTIKNNCRKPNGFGYPENNTVIYTFPGTEYTTQNFEWVWHDGKGAPKSNKELKLPNKEKLPLQGAMFIGEKGRLLLPHFMEPPRLIVEGKYKDIDIKKYDPDGKLGVTVNNYERDAPKHYHEFVDACLGRDRASAPFSYASRLTETILLGVIAGRFPNKTLHWDSQKAIFKESEANHFLSGKNRDF
ncbi:MAG: oxidoreductase [Flavobacteriaceae bacterium TMED171]|nr:oxidoreductase [Flavobacteriaceae bacterium]OUW31331.1 MAG: oxidoreductase [Flavobacteriaceae bacterium TMED171]